MEADISREKEIETKRRDKSVGRNRDQEIQIIFDSISDAYEAFPICHLGQKKMQRSGFNDAPMHHIAYRLENSEKK